MDSSEAANGAGAAAIAIVGMSGWGCGGCGGGGGSVVVAVGVVVVASSVLLCRSVPWGARGSEVSGMASECQGWRVSARDASECQGCE